MEDEHAYAMLATLEGTICTQLRTLICLRGTIHSQVIHIQFNPHTRSIIGRTYNQLFTPPSTQELEPHITLRRYNKDKGLISRRIDKVLWATTLLHNVDTLEVYEDAIRQTEEDLQRPADRSEPTSRAVGDNHPLSHTHDKPASTSDAAQAGTSPRVR